VLRGKDRTVAAKVLQKRAMASHKHLHAADVLRCLDHALYVSVGVGLHTYLPRRRMRLDHFTDAAQGVMGIAGIAGVTPVPIEDEHPVLVLRSDEEGRQAKAFHFLMQGCGARVAFFRDPCHRDWNDAQLAIKRIGMWSAPHMHISVIDVHCSCCMPNALRVCHKNHKDRATPA
jgi:hypothetical protein